MLRPIPRSGIPRSRCGHATTRNVRLANIGRSKSAPLHDQRNLCAGTMDALDEDAFDVGGMVFSQNFVSDDATKTAGRAPIVSAS